MRRQPVGRRVGGAAFRALTRRMVPGVSDTQCGFKLFRADVAEKVFKRQTLERFGFDAEVLYIAYRHGVGIAEVPVRWNHVDGSKVGTSSALHSAIAAHSPGDDVSITWTDASGASHTAT